MTAGDFLALPAQHRSLLLAVSGGPDSVALMLLCAQRQDRRIAVATVDHGLRDESRAEAEQVGEWAEALGLPHHLLIWEGEKPRTRIQERARDMRYALLAQCAERIGATAVVTAHHADDQAETILFRLMRGSGVAGLSGMSAETQIGKISLLRPLLHLRKAELVAVCDAAGHPCFSDPSNQNDAFARARLRKLAPALDAQGLGVEALLRLGDRARRADAALAHYAAQAQTQALIERQEGFTRFDANALRDLPVEILQRLLAAEIARLAPRPSLRLDRLERSAERLAEALARGEMLRLTLANLLIDADRRCVTLAPAPPRRNGAAESGATS